MIVEDMTVCRGITKAARELGVSYCHLWKVITGKYDSPSLLLKIERQMPSLFSSSICRIPYAVILDSYRDSYEWDDKKERFIKKKNITRNKDNG